MGLSFGKSFKMDHLRQKLPGSGLAASLGVRGARVSLGPRGTYVTLSGVGFRYQKKLKTSLPSSLEPVPVGTTSQSLVPIAACDGHIATASIPQLQDSSPEESLAEIQERAQRYNWFQIYLGMAALALLCLVVMELIPIVVPAALVLSVGAVWVYLWDRDRRTTRLIYDVGNPALLERLAACSAVGAALSESHRLWHVYFNIRTHDQKRNAGASSLVRRTRIHCAARTLPTIDCNVEPWSIPAGPQRILFLPDRLLVHEGGRFAGIPYHELAVSIQQTSFVEREAVPRDAQVVSQTWRFVNKSGGPDRRFNNNRQLPVVAYFEFKLQTRGGMHAVFQISSRDAARRAKVALDYLCQLSSPTPSPPSEVPAVRTAAIVSEPLPEALLPQLAPDSSIRTTAIAVTTVLRSIAVSDRRFSLEEKQLLDAAVKEFAAGDTALEASLRRLLPELRSDPANVTDALTWLSSCDAATQRRVIELASQMAFADGSVTPKEKERIEAIRAALPLCGAKGAEVDGSENAPLEIPSTPQTLSPLHGGN